MQGQRIINRDLSWLHFNERVLAEAGDETVPALERLRFATIVSSNLDEFFMIRVAEISRMARRDPSRQFPDGLKPVQLLAQIRDQVLRQKARQAETLDKILDDLRRHGIRIYTDFTGGARMDREIAARLPPIQYIVGRYTETPPPLVSEKIHVFVRFPREYAILTVQERASRLIELSSSGNLRRFALIERWLSDRAQSLFPDREIIEAFPFKIIRDADLRYRPDDEESLEEQIVEAVKQRSNAKVVRLEVDAPSYSEGALFLATAMRLDSSTLYRFNLPLDLRTLATVCRVKPHSRLHYPPIRPQLPPPLRKPRTLFDKIREKDILLHHPYDSFSAVVRFLHDAARDPQVTRIYHTVYRTSRQAPILTALKAAVKRGKRVTAYIEVKARFDELNNLRWAEELRQEGVKVVRPLSGLKVHSKMTQVFRKEDGVEVSYLHLGTGNYHPTTARQYTDLGLLTADADLGREIAIYFDAIIHHKLPSGFAEILIAPGNLLEQMLAMIREETRVQREGGRGHIIAKMNSLVDPKIISALYEASAAGVRVDLLIRGICCLRPGLKDLSENIRVVSVIDRYLEHSRVYYFRAAGADKIYLSSADWMPRNFFMRYELAFPVKDPALKKYIRSVVLENGLQDNVKAWQLKPDGTYARVPTPKSGKIIRSQFLFESLARTRYWQTALHKRS
ncbi:MAG: polyphosphate kinase 1 [Elusimicrobia bacterium RIFCSPLOWO2_12_FULL_59_9]|nr:MAG: polyphosphate kinase 1 [Elusimicrobia bacterium RIFCSPLOWO2_12_FULL_59_9]